MAIFANKEIGQKIKEKYENLEEFWKLDKKEQEKLIREVTNKKIKDIIIQKYGNLEEFLKSLNKEGILEENFGLESDIDKIYKDLKINLSKHRKYSNKWSNIFDKLGIVSKYYYPNSFIYIKKIIQQRIKDKYGTLKSFVEYLIDEKIAKKYFDIDKDKIYGNLKVNLVVSIVKERKISEKWLKIFDEVGILSQDEIKEMEEKYKKDLKKNKFKLNVFGISIRNKFYRNKLKKV
jgi:hypothetical protein